MSTPKTKVRKPPAPFSVQAAFAIADDILSRETTEARIVRPKKLGAFVARFALPLALCKPQNATRHGQPWALGKIKQDLLLVMLSQHGRVGQPLPGRPQVLCLRLSSTEPDKFADSFKHAIDRLTVKHSGLGYLRDDRPKDCDVEQWWEYAPPKKGCCIIEVRTGCGQVTTL